MITPPQRVLYLHFLLKSYEYIANSINIIPNALQNFPNVLSIPHTNVNMMLNVLSILLRITSLMSTVNRKRKIKLVRPHFLIRLLRGYRLVFICCMYIMCFKSSTINILLPIWDINYAIKIWNYNSIFLGHLTDLMMSGEIWKGIGIISFG